MKENKFFQVQILESPRLFCGWVSQVGLDAFDTENLTSLKMLMRQSFFMKKRLKFSKKLKLDLFPKRSIIVF